MTTTKNCTTCRYHRRENRPQSAEVGFDTLIQLGDDVPFYICMVEGNDKDIGAEPVLCDKYEVPQGSSRLAQLDAMLARRNKAGCDD